MFCSSAYSWLKMKQEYHRLGYNTILLEKFANLGYFRCWSAKNWGTAGHEVSPIKFRFKNEIYPKWWEGV